MSKCTHWRCLSIKEIGQSASFTVVLMFPPPFFWVYKPENSIVDGEYDPKLASKIYNMALIPVKHPLQHNHLQLINYLIPPIGRWAEGEVFEVGGVDWCRRAEDSGRKALSGPDQKAGKGKRSRIRGRVRTVGCSGSGPVTPKIL